MIVWIRNGVLIFLLLTIVYAVLSYRARRKQMDKLSAEYASKQPEETKGEFLAKGLQKYNRSHKPKLIFLVYLIPLFIMGVLIYLAQYTT